MARTGVSSLLRAARAAQARQASLEDSIAAYEYDLSPKDQAAYDKYAGYLNRRLSLTQNTDPAKALNYQKSLTTANRSFTSSELSRATTQVMYGAIDDRSKLNTMMNLYQRALANGDENLAQRIESQAATLQNKILNTGRAGGGGGGGTSSADRQLKLEVDNTVAQLKDDLSSIKYALSRGGNRLLSQIESSRPGASYFSTAKGIIESIANTYRTAADKATDPNKRQDYLEEYNKIISGEKKFDIGFAGGEDKNNKSLNEINTYIQQRSLGSDPTRIQMGPEGAKLVETKISGFSRYYKTPEGQIGLTTTQTQSVDPAFERAAKKAQSNLKKFGIESRTNDQGYLVAENKATGQQIIGTVDPYGNILYQGLDDQGNPVVKRYVTSENKDEIVSQQEQQAIAESGNQIDPNRAVLDTGGEIQRGLGNLLKPATSFFEKNIGSLFQKKQQSDLNTQLGKLAGELGRGDYLRGIGTFVSNPLGFLSNIGGLQSRVKEAQQQVQAKRAIDAENARREAERLRQAAEESARMIQQQRASEEAARQRSVVFRTPQIDYNKIANPDVRAITAISEQLKTPFGKNLYDLNRFR